MNQLLDLWIIVWPLVMLGLLIDRYFLEEKRLVGRLVDKCKKSGACTLCGRPMKIEEG